LSRILAYTSPARGHLFPIVPILDELRRRGHEVALRTLAADVPAQRERGFEAAPIAPVLETIEMDDWRARTPIGAMNRAIRVFGARAEHDAADLEAAIDQDRPDALLVDVNSWGAMAVAESRGGPWAAFCPYPLLLRSRVGPPPGPGLRPARGAAGRLRDRLLAPLISAGLDRVALPALNPLRASVGLPPLAHAEAVYLTPPLLLYLTAEPFEYPRPDWPASIVMVGPCDWEAPGELPAELREVERPLVLVTGSSERQDDARLAATALRALAEEPIHVVATLPADASSELPRTANSTVLGYAPHGPILDRAACAITHGGMGATQKALARGVPVCAVPFGRDQFDVARRVEVAAAGTRLPAPLLSPSRLRARVREAVARREGAERVAAAFRAAGGAVAAADAFERRLSL
jgi:MGT family glycosyltransferase